MAGAAKNAKQDPHIAKAPVVLVSRSDARGFDLPASESKFLLHRMIGLANQGLKAD